MIPRAEVCGMPRTVEPEMGTDLHSQTGRALARAIVRWRPLLVALCTLPLATYVGLASVTWLERPSPGFFVLENAMVPTVSGFDWPPDRSTFFHSQVTAVDGDAVRTGAEIYERVAARPAGTTFHYTLRRDGVAVERALPSRNFTVGDYLQTCGVFLVFGITYLILGILVACLQPRARAARVFLLQATVGGVYAITGVALHQASHPVLGAICLVAECLFPATYVHLALVFPVERPLRGAWRALPVAPYVVSLALLAGAVGGFYGTPPTLDGFHVVYLYTALSIVFFAGSMVAAYVRNPQPLVRARIKAVLPALVLGTAAMFVIFLNNAFPGRDLPVQFGLVPSFAFYVGVAYAIAKHDLFDIDRVVRQSFIYGVLSIVVLGAYASVLAVSSRLVPAFASENRALIGAAFVLVLAFGLEPLRRGVQEVVDRAFYRSRLDGARTVRDLSAILASILDLREIAAQVTRVVTESMQLESATILLLGLEDEQPVLWSRRAGADLHQAEKPAEGEPAFAQSLTAAAVARSRAEVLRIEDPALPVAGANFLRGTGSSVLLPLVVSGRPIGAFALGAKQSGQPLGSAEVDVLRTLANQTAIALQNARSYHALAELNRVLDEKVQEQTGALRDSNTRLRLAYEDLKSAQAQIVQSEKMASLGQLVAGVAHELNNPASFVHGGLANLTEYLEAFVAVIAKYEQLAGTDPALREEIEAARADAGLDYLLRETPELLRICTEGSERIKAIVEDLRIFVRADPGGGVSTDVTAAIEATLGLLGDHVARGGIAVVKEYQPVPSVRAHATQLNQVWMNLLRNAMDAVAGRPEPEIRVRVRPLPAGESAGASIEVEITDNGSGIPTDVVGRVFDPFFTTKPVGQGTGLGLSIAYGAVRSHGGTIAVHSEPDTGTTMTVRLPVEAPPI